MRNTLTAAAAAVLVLASVTAHAAIRITTSAIEFTPKVDITIIDSLRLADGTPALGDLGGNLQTGFARLRPTSPLEFGAGWFTYNREAGGVPDVLGLKRTFHAANLRPAITASNGQIIAPQIDPAPVSIAFKVPAAQFGFDYYSPFSDLKITVFAGKQSSSYLFAQGSGFAGLIDARGFDSILIEANSAPTLFGIVADNFRYTAAQVQNVQAPVPEPASYALMSAGLIGMMWMARRRQRQVR